MATRLLKNSGELVDRFYLRFDRGSLYTIVEVDLPVGISITASRDDTALWLSVPLQPAPAGIEPVDLQLGVAVAAATAAEDWKLVAGELAATTNEDWGAAGESGLEFGAIRVVLVLVMKLWEWPRWNLVQAARKRKTGVEFCLLLRSRRKSRVKKENFP